MIRSRAESRPQRALNSPTAAAGLATTIPQGSHSCHSRPVTIITTNISSEAETQQSPNTTALSAANTKPGTTGSGQGMAAQVTLH